VTPGSSSGAETILVVDDQEEIRKVVGRMLRARGFHVLLAANGHEALRLGSEVEALRRVDDQAREIDLLVTDVAMPGMSGPDLQRELTRRDQSIPIVFITAQRDEGVRPRLLAQGAVDCLFKPFEAADLLQALNTALRAN